MRGILTRYAAAAVLSAGMMFAQQVGGPPAQQPEGQAYRIQQLAQVLDLTPDQQTQAQTIMQQARDAALPVMQQLRQNRQQLRQLIEAGNTAQFNQQVQQFATTQGNLHGQLALIRARAMEQFFTMLNPQQRQRAIALYNLRMAHGHGHGWR
jgi:Spy/CpxP family protein refolding chaperone